MKLTLKQLKDQRACADQAHLFKKLFGAEVSVTKARCLKHAQQFNFGWAANRLLPASARAEYLKATASAWAEYLKATASASAAYNKAIALAYNETAWAAYNKAKTPVLAYNEYSKATAPARAEYHKAKALAFWQASKGERR